MGELLPHAIRTVPVADDRFRADVDVAVRELATDRGPLGAHQLEDQLPHLLNALRPRYRGVWARWQDALAASDDGPVLYVFRDPKPPRDAPPPMPRLPRDRGHR